jgi:hypothetical protein
VAVAIRATKRNAKTKKRRRICGFNGAHPG